MPVCGKTHSSLSYILTQHAPFCFSHAVINSAFLKISKYTEAINPNRHSLPIFNDMD